MGVGDAVKDGRMLDAALEDLTIIAGQKPVVTKARKSIAGFKLREGMPIGAKVTLRGDRMWEFFDRLVSLALPRIRDFRGLSPDAFDGHGNYTMGVTEQLIFPEIDYDKVAKVRGMDITIVTTATTDDEGRALLVALGFPLDGAVGRRAGELRREYDMAKKALINKQEGKQKFRVRAYTRCQRCGRPRAVYKRVPALPHLLPRAGARGRAAGGDEGLMVTKAKFASNVSDPVGRPAHPDPQREPGVQGRPRGAGVQVERGDPEDPGAGGLHRRLRPRGRGHRAAFRIRLKYGQGPRAHDHGHQAHLDARAPRLHGPRPSCRACSAGWASRSCRPRRA